MSREELRSSIALSVIFALRMLGLFMILPVFSLHSQEYSGGGNPALMGIAIGIYGLTQAVFQIPFGRLSDRIGRKRVITGGLIIFAAGSVVAALADSIGEVIAGRALQGCGAVAAAVMALTADLTREEQRTKAMAIIGVSIGLGFAVAMVLGPAVTRSVGLSGLFWLTGVFALGGIAVLHAYVPNPVRIKFHRDTEVDLKEFRVILGNLQLARLDFGIFVLHLIITASFVVLPLSLVEHGGLAPDTHWMLYIVVLILSVAIMVPFVIHADRHNRLKPIFIGSVVVLGVTQVGFATLPSNLMVIGLIMVAYFAVINILEASLPSLVSRIAPLNLKGTALGMYSTSQYLGAFLGGAVGGWLYGAYGMAAVFLGCAVMALLWVAIALSMGNPRPLSVHLLNVGNVEGPSADDLSRRLLGVTGVAEALIVPEDGIAYLRVDRHHLDREALRAFSQGTP